MTGFPVTPMIPVSWGEVIDKLAILEIKTQRLSARDALANVAKELSFLRDVAREVRDIREIETLALRLKDINASLWDAEEKVREKERAGVFDQDFITTARSIYAGNEERAKIKREINRALDSGLVEEKNYQTSRCAAGI